ncbi:MAG: hypothetical protein A2X61_03465 [Ignavibacteria bacterium GWB2_35_12]|nr:MAG: hypothetical protein A2X63_10140 [Ignavibacteria bacterium GWA2_35_8]OGU42098.1 MAG: hypothetical protein A2X61_03465 [Ignavibacteria bacterium GWB2_35_12]OGU95580.1 MAG: hypothetical protein A2220_06415 [Ignavibacteria bacterium RIFOXYA2_FULL_35_10]OGV20252.1 MAG: hypothetical protein A2475_07880 [Ignavibacteria bacterium RIFOXYC2_FULL_35_21]
MMSIEQLLDLTMELPLTEREILLDVLTKRNAEEKRNEIAQYYEYAKNEFIQGNLKSQPLPDIINELEKELD